jgi:hypothetical protein
MSRVAFIGCPASTGISHHQVNLTAYRMPQMAEHASWIFLKTPYLVTRHGRNYTGDCICHHPITGMRRIHRRSALRDRGFVTEDLTDLDNPVFASKLHPKAMA